MTLFASLREFLSRSKAREATTMSCAICGSKPQVNASRGWRLDARPDPQPDYPGELQPVLYCPNCRRNSATRGISDMWTSPTRRPSDPMTRRLVYRAPSRPQKAMKPRLPKDPRDLTVAVLDVLSLNDKPLLTRLLADAVDARMTDLTRAIRLLERSGAIFRSRDVKGRTVWEVSDE